VVTQVKADYLKT